MRASGAVLACVACAVACGPGAAPPRSLPVVANVVARSARPLAPTPHSDFAKLRRFHNYYRVLSVGEHRHHFVAFFHHHELVTARYDVPVAPGAPVRFIGDGFGLITAPPAAEPIPASIVPIAEAVKADLRARRGAIDDILVLYVGAFRTLSVEEIVVRKPSTSKGELYAQQLTLAANEELTSIRGPARYSFGSGSTLRLDDVGEHLDVPNWVDGHIGRQGRAQLWNLFEEPSSFDADVRQTFDAAVLATARRIVTHEPGLRFEELASERDPRSLPPDLEERRPFTFYVNAVGNGNRQSSATAWIDPSRALGGEERVELRLSMDTARHGNAIFDARARLRMPPIPEGAGGAIELPVRIDYQVTATNAVHAKPFVGTAAARVRVMVDGDRFHVLDFADNIPAHTFPGPTPHETFEVHLGFQQSD